MDRISTLFSKANKFSLLLKRDYFKKTKKGSCLFEKIENQILEPSF